MWKVNGTMRATPIVAVRPGMAPIKIPSTMEASQGTRMPGLRMLMNASNMAYNPRKPRMPAGRPIVNNTPNMR